MSANDIEGDSGNMDVADTDAEEMEPGEEEFDDSEFDVETADAEKAAGSGGDSFGDIEDFNEDMIETELSNEDISTEAPEGGSTQIAVEEAPRNEFDVENADLEQASAAPAPVETSVADNKITNLEYKSFDSGGTIVISAEKPFTYQVRDEPEFNQTIIEVGDVDLAERFKLPYIAKDFGQPVATINAYQERGSTTARFVIQYKTKMKPSIQQRQNSLLVMNSSSGTGTGPTNYVADAVGSSETDFTVTSSGSGSSSSGTSSTGGPSVSRKRITIEMYGVPIKEVIQTIAEDVGVNVIIDDNVDGSVNVKLRNVEWEEGLTALLQAHGLGYQRKGQILRIAKNDTITSEINNAQERIKAEVAADLLTQPMIMKIIPVNYGELESLQGQIAPLLTQNEKVTVDRRSNSLVVTGFPESIKRSEQLVKSLDIQPLQVLIEGKIIEANNEFSKAFGIQWVSSTTFSLGSQDGALTSTIRGDSNPSQVLGGFVGDLTIGTFDVLGDLRALLSIFEREQKIKVLSSPKVTTVNKERATIRQTTQVPIFQTTVIPNVGTQNTVTFQEAELLLEVSPQVTFNSDMLLDIRVKRDIPGDAIAGSRQINRREAQTKVIVKDGQSAVLGGIFSMDERLVEVGVPYLRDVPVLGYLFKSKRRETVKNELVIFLSPKILNPESMVRAMEMSNSTTPGLPSSDQPTNDGTGESLDDLEEDIESM